MKKWFNNLKISKKLISAFVVVAIIAGFCTAYVATLFNVCLKANKELYENYTVPISEMTQIAIDYQTIYTNITGIVSANDTATISAIEAKIDASRQSIDTNSEKITKQLQSQQSKTANEKFLASKKAANNLITQVIALAKQNQDEQAVALLMSENGIVAFTDCIDQINKLTDVTVSDAQKNSEDNVNKIYKAIFSMCILAVLFAGSIIAIGVLVTKILIKPINKATKMIKELSLRHYDTRLSYISKDEVGQMSTAMNLLADDLQYVVLASMKKISDGNVAIEILPKDNKDELAPALLEMVHTIDTLIEETKKLAVEAENGNLSARGDISKFKGEYINIVNAINGTLESAAMPIQEVSEVMEQISQGNLDIYINGAYKGQYQVLVNAVNSTVQELNSTIHEIVSILTRIADSDIAVSDIRQFKGNFSQITVALNKIVEGLNDTMKEINAAAVQVAAGSEQISDSSVLLSQGSEEQAGSVEEVTSAITQMAAQVQQNAANANEANTLSQTAKENALQGNEEMQKMVQAMYAISDASTNISKIIKVIDDIAFQTNILALNAAVEAARAGQYGKGFAVVAEEVRNLAQKSAAAAKETTVMIGSSIEKVKLGTDIASNTEASLREIVGSVTRSSDLVDQIAAASNEQATAIAQISHAIEQVSEIVQNNSATAEETASASEELSSQAEMLKSMVGQFKLKNR